MQLINQNLNLEQNINVNLELDIKKEVNLNQVQLKEQHIHVLAKGDMLIQMFNFVQSEPLPKSLSEFTEILNVLKDDKSNSTYIQKMISHIKARFPSQLDLSTDAIFPTTSDELFEHTKNLDDCNFEPFSQQEKQLIIKPIVSYLQKSASKHSGRTSTLIF